ncbi:MAG: hypothetical protein P8J44_01920 [Gammaproteobacteria bacterium]|nr:hypothetical protein [Gammaproteobacteria bacterium]
MKTLVIQSCNEESIPFWIEACLDSVRVWTEQQGYQRCFVGDEIFDLVPDWYLQKTGKGPIATDYARLVLLKEALLNQGYDQAIWLDADMFVLDPTMTLASAGNCAFGQEIWVQNESGKLKARKNVHNAVCQFRRGCVVLPFLIETVASIIRRANPEKIAPQMVGPKLLSALHSLHDFDLLPQVGAISPEVAEDIVAGGGAALSLLQEKLTVPLQAVNLCASLMDDEQGAKLVASLPLLVCH